jgi:hypothetical protein
MVKIHIVVLGVMILCSMVCGYQHFEDTCWLHIQGLIPDDGTVGSSKTLGTTNQATWCHNKEAIKQMGRISEK